MRRTNPSVYEQIVVGMENSVSSISESRINRYRGQILSGIFQYGKGHEIVFADTGKPLSSSRYRLSMQGRCLIMMSESEMDILERWSETHDREEYMRLGKILMPDISTEELEKSFQEILDIYQPKQTDE